MRKQTLLCILLFLSAALLGGCQRERFAQDVLLDSFCYETIGTTMGSETELSIVHECDGFIVTQSSNGGKLVRTAHIEREIMVQATDVLRAHDALSWNGYAKSDPNVLDGSSFTLHIVFDDRTTISARGTNRYPKGLLAAVQEIGDMVDRFLREPEQ